MFTLKEATLQDIPTIKAVAKVAFPATYKEILSEEQLQYMMNWMYSTDSLEKQMNDGHVFFIAYEECEAAGYVSIRKEEADVYHLEKIYVLHYFQGYKLGRILFEKALTYARETNGLPCQVRLNVNRHNKALGFYEHLGMRKLSEGDFPIGNGYYMNDYIMGIDV